MSIRRIVVGLEPSPQARSALTTAADLARRMQAELVGLFVENENLLRLAGLPFACEVCFPSALTRGIDTRRMERSLRAMAEDSRRRLAAAAGHPSLRWSFHVSRGAAGHALLAASTRTDLLVVTTAQWTPVLADAAAGAAASVLLLHKDASVLAPMAALCTLEASAGRVAESLAGFAPAFGAQTALLMLSDDAAAAGAWLRDALPRFSARGLRVTARIVPPRDPAAIHRAIEDTRPGVVVVAGVPATAFGANAPLRALLDAEHRPLLLLPSASPDQRAPDPDTPETA